MKQVRQNVFETNSSSTHSICIAKNQLVEFPEKIIFEGGEFGWEIDTLDTIQEKTSYLYTGFYANDRLNDFQKVVSLLKLKGIEIDLIEIPKGSYNYYIDHSDELNDFLTMILKNEENLMSFLFSPLSFILTGNDNCECDVNINVDYDHEAFYKS